MNRDRLRRADLDTDEWEAAAEGVLADVGFDTELGKEMGRDAIRVSNGELDEETFHERYHERVQAEFGVDGRPTAPEDDV